MTETNYFKLLNPNMTVLDSEKPLNDLLDGARPIGLLSMLRDEYISDFKEDIERFSIAKDEILINQDDPATDVFIVVTGKLQAVMTLKNGKETVVGEILPGEPVGEMQNFTSGFRNARVYGVSQTDLIRLPKEIFEKLAVRLPGIVRRMAAISRRRLRKNQVIVILSDFFGHLDAVDLKFIQDNTQWVSLKRGEHLFKQGDPGNSLCVLISGRLLAAVKDSEGNERMVGEVTQGELVGEMAILTGAPRSASVYALRDSLLALFSNETIQHIITKYPQVMMYTARTIIARLSKTIRAPSHSRLMTSIAVIPANPEVPLRDFVNRLEKALLKYTPTLHLNSERLDSLIGIEGVAQTEENNPYNGRLSIALEEEATKPHLIIYESDRHVTPWTRRCIRQADQILILAKAGDNPKMGEIESELLNFDRGITAAGQTLILVHPEGETLPSGTASWLSERNVDSHYHVRMEKDDDYLRLARIFTGNAVGLVLGGGGARGMAHLGVIRALREEGIPIDMIGGCSIGAIVAGQPAMGWDNDAMMEISNRFFVKGKPTSDYTLPVLSIVRGKKLEQYLHMGFGDTQIEDLWITYFCVSSNLSKAELVVHRKGMLWNAVRTSIAIPGMFAPVLHNNDLLVDGGVLNNVPGDVMQRICKGRVIAVDVSPKREFHIPGDKIPSSWDIIRGRFLSSKGLGTIPSIFDVLTRSTLLGSVNKADEVKANVDLYLKPPIDKFSMLEFSALSELADIGYNYAIEEIRNWKKDQQVI